MVYNLKVPRFQHKNRGALPKLVEGRALMAKSNSGWDYRLLIISQFIQNILPALNALFRSEALFEKCKKIRKTGDGEVGDSIFHALLF